MYIDYRKLAENLFLDINKAYLLLTNSTEESSVENSKKAIQILEQAKECASEKLIEKDKKVFWLD